MYVPFRCHRVLGCMTWLLFGVQVIRHAVSGMLPKNKLRERRLDRLKIFPSENMGILGMNIMRSWEDGTLPSDFDPSKPVTGLTLRELREKRQSI